MPNQYGEKIAALRRAKGMTQADLGKEMNVTFQAVSKWERGESLPDLETLSRIAKFFEVPLGYFEDDEAAEAFHYYRESTGEGKMLGICTQCGKVVHSGEEAETDPFLVCKACSERIAAEQERKKQELADLDRRKKAVEQARIEGMKAKDRSYCNRGLIWGAVITAIFMILAIVGSAMNSAGYAEYLISIGISVFFIYPFVTQLFWDGFIREVTLTGGKIVGTPGVIFSLDLDGIIFLIVVKILFAILRMLIFIVTLLFFVLVAILFSPFAFVPQLIKCRRGTLD